MRNRTRVSLALATLILIFLVAVFVAWGETPAQPLTEAFANLDSDTLVTVSSSRWLTFTPVSSQPSTGFIFYPGGRVDYRAYAPAAHEIAANGYLVVIVPMPLNLAIFGVNAATDVQNAYPQIKHWVIGGHSLGGSMAAMFAKAHPGAVQGLVLWASYPASGDDLSNSALRVLSIYGTSDGLATKQKIEASHLLLPADTEWIQIIGGNHAQFGWYGDQAGDHPALITRTEQQSQIIKATISFLEGLL